MITHKIHKTNEANKSVRRSILVQEAAYGFNKYQLADKMRNAFHISDPYLQGLDVYHITHYTGRDFAKSLNDGLVDSLNRTYAVIYHNCTPYNAKRAQEVRLSFRAAKKEFGIDPIVLVQIVSQEA